MLENFVLSHSPVFPTRNTYVNKLTTVCYFIGNANT